MTERKKEKKNKKKEEDIRIDYDHIDVADIMDQIKSKVAKELKEQSRQEIPEEEFYPAHVPFEAGVEEPAPGPKGKMKRVLLKIMKPVSPLIKLLVLPVHEQIMQTDRKLHQTNMRLDNLNARLDQAFDKLSTDLKNLEKRLDQTNQRLDLTYSDINEIMQYTKLLHNLSHNMVVELSKLKVEEENLKSKTRIMKKDFESLGRREKALEKEIFK